MFYTNPNTTLFRYLVNTHTNTVWRAIHVNSIKYVNIVWGEASYAVTRREVDLDVHGRDFVIFYLVSDWTLKEEGYTWKKMRSLTR